MVFQAASLAEQKTSELLAVCGLLELKQTAKKAAAFRFLGFLPQPKYSASCTSRWDWPNPIASLVMKFSTCLALGISKVLAAPESVLILHIFFAVNRHAVDYRVWFLVSSPKWEFAVLVSAGSQKYRFLCLGRSLPGCSTNHPNFHLLISGPNSASEFLLSQGSTNPKIQGSAFFASIDRLPFLLIRVTHFAL